MEPDKVTVNLTVSFDHSKESTLEACMYDMDEIRKFNTYIIKEIIKEIGNREGRTSRIIEWVAENMTEKELPYIILKYIDTVLKDNLGEKKQ